MFGLIAGVFTRIVSNSGIGLFQKILTLRGQTPSVINFYTYLGLTVLGFFVVNNLEFTTEILLNFLIMGFLGALGNYFIIKALSCGEMSLLAPINSYKPVIAMLAGILLLREMPAIKEVAGVLLIIAGTCILSKGGKIFSESGLYRFAALVFSGTEAVFIKKVIILTDINTAFFFWAFSGLIFSMLFSMKHSHKILRSNLIYQILLIFSAGIMQYSTNYVFSRMNVSYALALFQLSTILSVFIGVNIFKERGLFIKLFAALIMIAGAIVIII